MLSISKNLSSIKPFKPQGSTNVKETELGLFYANDMHGDIYNLAKFKTAHDTFKKENEKVANLTLSAGDCLFGSDKQRNSLMVKLFNLMHLDALALGNHEFAGGSKLLSDSLQNAEFKSVSSNLKIGDKCSLKDRVADKKLVKSAVFMKGGHKFAVIGASPVDSYIGKNEKGVKPLDMDKTINAINEEAKKLEASGVNKIILCSHLGYDEKHDLRVARETEGIDIIVGGHSHTAIDGVNTQTIDKKHKLNLLMSKRNEPVFITQAGGMNNYVGYLNAVFDEKGVLKTEKLKNELIEVSEFDDSNSVKVLMNQILGKKSTLAKVLTPYTPKGIFEERYVENPLANEFADAILAEGKRKCNADIALYHGATIRGGAKDEITNYDIKYTMLPFNNELVAIDITEKDLVDVINNMTGSLLTSNSDPQVLRCAGMEYSIHNDLEFAKSGNKNALINLKIGEKSIDVKCPSETKTVKLVLNSYLLKHDLTKNVLSKYSDKASTVGYEQDIFMKHLSNKKEISGTTNGEKRVKFTVDYPDRTSLNDARKEILGNDALFI